MMCNTYSSSWCEKIIVTSLSVICIILGVDYKFSVLPFSGILLAVYLLIIIVITTWTTFIYLQNLLRHNKAFEYDPDKNFVLKHALKLYNFVTARTAELKPAESVPANLEAVRELRLDEIDAQKICLDLVPERRATIKTIDERIEEFVKDIEIRFILRWYVNISNDPSFPIEAKSLLDEIVRRFLQIIVEVDGKKITYGFATIFLKHLKEFRKTVKRSRKNNDGTIEEHYRYSHVGSKSPKALEHFVYNLTASVLKQFINWELWNSLPCRSLVSVLARKFTMYVLVYVSAPGFLNYQIMKACTSQTTKDRLKLDKFYFVSISDVDHAGNLRQLKARPVVAVVTKHQQQTNMEKLRSEDGDTPKVSPRKKQISPETIPEVHDVVDSITRSKSTVQIQSESQTPENNSTEENEETDLDVDKIDGRPKPSEPVKIHESKSHSNRTWRNSSDLECISLGQDLLAFQEFTDPNSQIQELIEKKLWKDAADGGDDEKPGFMWDIPESWVGEELETADLTAPILETAPPASPTTDFKSYLKSSANTAALITNTMKPIGNVTASTLHNMKELQQSTVNTVNNVVKPVSQVTTNAMHRIGEMQDEAAGMVEGILDFGIAGLRKGLRLTGLQENFTELTQKAKHEFQRADSHKPKCTEPVKIVSEVRKLVKTPRVTSEEKSEQSQMQSSSESDESVWMNPLTKESPSFDGDILLERTPDSVSKPFRDIPQITEDIVTGVEDSPDPEYEEAQDLASTIAKLRNLLQQKSSESNLTTPALSPMPQDEVAKTPAEPPVTDLTKVDGAMPSLYKFCARTATGVFQNTLNTIKTALPGNVNENSRSLGRNSDDWTFIEADTSTDDFYSRMRRLLSERRAFCTVDTAYEAIDSLDVIDQPEMAWTAPVSQLDDELDEFDLQVPVTKALLDIICELIGDTNTCLRQESVVKTVLLLIGNYSEEFVTKQSEGLLHNVNKFVGRLPENVGQDVMALKLDEMVKMCTEVFPCSLKGLLGESTIETGVALLINSLQSQKINQDVVLQLFELFASQLIAACSQVSPAYSA